MLAGITNEDIIHFRRLYRRQKMPDGYQIPTCGVFTLICSKCGYMMDSFEKECARCNGKGQTAPPAQRVPGSSSSPSGARKSRTRPVWVYLFGLVSLAAIIALGITALFRPKPEPKIAATVVKPTPAPVVPVPAQAPAPTPIQQYAPPGQPIRTPQAPPRNVRPVARQPNTIVQPAPTQPQRNADGMTQAEASYAITYLRWLDTLNALLEPMHRSKDIPRSQLMDFFARVDGIWTERLQTPVPPVFAVADSFLGDGLAETRKAKLMFQRDGGYSAEMATAFSNGGNSIGQGGREAGTVVNRLKAQFGAGR